MSSNILNIILDKAISANNKFSEEVMMALHPIDYWKENRPIVVNYARLMHVLTQNPRWYSTLLDYVEDCDWEGFLEWVQTHPPDGPGIPQENAYCITDYLFHDCETYPGYEELIEHNSPRW